MFTAYHDAAGGQDHGFIVVSGWLSSLTKWDRFECDWRLLLAKHDVTHFHMKQFVTSDGPFKGWEGNDGKRTIFLKDAVDIIKSHVEYGMACFVEYAVFDKINKDFHLDRWLGVPYSLAGRDCAAKANNYLRNKHSTSELPDINYLFEDGDTGKGQLMRVMHRDLGKWPDFRPSRDQKHKKTGATIKGVVQLQAADFAAYELRKSMVDDPREEWLPWQYRRSFQALARIDSWWGHYTEKDLLAQCKLANIPRRVCCGDEKEGD